MVCSDNSKSELVLLIVRGGRSLHKCASLLCLPTWRIGHSLTTRSEWVAPDSLKTRRRPVQRRERWASTKLNERKSSFSAYQIILMMMKMISHLLFSLILFGCHVFTICKCIIFEQKIIFFFYFMFAALVMLFGASRYFSTMLSDGASRCPFCDAFWWCLSMPFCDAFWCRSEMLRRSLVETLLLSPE